MDSKPKAKKDPFKTKKSPSATAQISDTVTPDDSVQQAIDGFRDCQEQAKHYEGEATVYKDKILDFARGKFAQRVQSGLDKSYKILGDESMVTYVVMDSSAGLTEDEVSAIGGKWGDAAAEELTERDFRSIRFDAKVLEANYDLVVQALQALPEEVLDNLFKPMLMKARSGAVQKAQKFTKSDGQLQELLMELKLKHYIR